MPKSFCYRIALFARFIQYLLYDSSCCLLVTMFVIVLELFFITKEKDRLANCKLVYIEAMAQFFNNDLDYVVEDYYDMAEFDDNPFENDDNSGEVEVCWFRLILNMKYLILF